MPLNKISNPIKKEDGKREEGGRVKKAARTLGKRDAEDWTRFDFYILVIICTVGNVILDSSVRCLALCGCLFTTYLFVTTP